MYQRIVLVFFVSSHYSSAKVEKTCPRGNTNVVIGQPVPENGRLRLTPERLLLPLGRQIRPLVQVGVRPAAGGGPPSLWPVVPVVSVVVIVSSWIIDVTAWRWHCSRHPSRETEVGRHPVGRCPGSGDGICRIKLDLGTHLEQTVGDGGWPTYQTPNGGLAGATTTTLLLTWGRKI